MMDGEMEKRLDILCESNVNDAFSPAALFRFKLTISQMFSSNNPRKSKSKFGSSVFMPLSMKYAAPYPIVQVIKVRWLVLSFSNSEICQNIGVNKTLTSGSGNVWCLVGMEVLYWM